MSKLVNSGDEVDIRIPDGEGGSLLVSAVARSSADIGETFDAEPVADRKDLITGLLLTATASNPNEGRATTAGFTSFTNLQNTFAAGVLSLAPRSYQDWDQSFWSWTPDPDRLDITTANVRETSYTDTVPTPPTQLSHRVTDDVGFSITWSVYARVYGGAYPALPDLQVSSDQSGALQTLTLDGTTLPYAPNTPLLLRHVLQTKGGGLATYMAHDWRQSFAPP